MLLAQIIVNGILLGGLYGLMALGMALVWGVLNIVNLAHGAFIMLGGYAVYFLFAELGIDPFLALPIAMAVMFAFGYLLQLLVLNQIVRSAMLNTLLITFGLDVVLTYLAQLLFTADFRTIGPSYAGANFTPVTRWSFPGSISVTSASSTIRLVLRSWHRLRASRVPSPRPSPIRG